MSTQPSLSKSPGIRDFFAALQLQMTVIGALMMRELHTRFGRENLGFLWMVGEPLLFCFGVTVMWSLLRAPYEHGIPIVAFVISGYVPLTLWRHSIGRSIHCFRSNASLLYHRQVSVLDLLAARLVIEICGCSMAYLVTGFAFSLVGLYEWPQDWGLFLLGWTYHVLYAIGTALIIGCVTEMAEWMEKLTSLLTYISLPLSGFMFMVDWLPDRMQPLALYVPSVGAYEVLRAGQFGPGVRVHYDLGYETFICFALIGIGLILCKRVRPYIVIE